jgi:NAD(P)-dependent dehydrogenase (short-subunit alcohol dehydrogenase family)
MSNWDDVLSLFQSTWKTFGQIDVVLANAGIHSEKSWLADAVKPSDVLVRPDMDTIRVNLDGMVYMTNCAVHYFARRPHAKTQLVFTGSAARSATP